MISTRRATRSYGATQDRTRTISWSFFRHTALLVSGFAVILPAGLSSAPAMAQAPATAPATPAARQIGTVKAVSGSTLSLTSDAGQTFTVTVADSARVLQLAPGSTDLKTAQTIALTDVAVGDRVLVIGKVGDTPDAFLAGRVILMKSSDIAQKHAAEEEDWQKRGSGGLVSAVDAATGTITITARAKKTTVETDAKTTFRRYAGDSVKFEAAQVGSFGDIRPGDQLRVRGAKSDDGSSIHAEEIVSGSFRNLSGTIATINPTSTSFTLKDLTTKKTYTVLVTDNSNVHALPADVAQRFAARARGAQSGGTPPGAGSGGTPPAAAPAGANAGNGAPAGAGSGFGSGAAAGRGGTDLSQVVSHLPGISLKDLHVGDAVMVVASEPQAGSLTAITLLSGVEPILAAAPSGSAATTLSPWNMSGPGGDAQ